MLLATIGCDTSLDDQIAELVENKNRWVEHAQNRQYSFVYIRNCFCRYSGEEILITVKDHRVASAKMNKKEVNVKTLPTIKQLFELILEGIKRQEWEKNIAIQAEYNPKYGYPTNISFRSNSKDDNASISVKNLNFM